MLKDFGDHENSRVRDLADLMLMLDAGLLDPSRVAIEVNRVWAERGGEPPAAFPALPESWPPRYEALAAENGIEPPSFAAATERAAAFWRSMFDR